MANKRHTAEQIIAKLREAEILLGKDTKMPQVCRKHPPSLASHLGNHTPAGRDS